VKIALLRSPSLYVSLLPSVAFGLINGEDAGQELRWLAMQAGARVLASTQGGLYGGIGYHYQRLVANDDGADANDSTTSSHNLTFAIGADLSGGSLRIRPELAIVYAPVIDDEDDDGVTGLWVFPNVTFAIAAPSH
jgi:hypothetical protein